MSTEQDSPYINHQENIKKMYWYGVSNAATEKDSNNNIFTLYIYVCIPLLA